MAPAIDLTKHFIFYVTERKGVAVGVLIQKLVSETQPVAYLSQTGQNGPQVAWVPKGHRCYQPYHQGSYQDHSVRMALTPCQVKAILELKGHMWMTRARLT
jgi:hypothetical protein